MARTKTHRSELQHSLLGRIAAIIGAVLIVLVALGLFMNANNERIVAQNSQYLQTSAGQTARRVDDLFTSSLKSVQTAAVVFEESLRDSGADLRQKVTELDFSQFDHTMLITPNGMAYNSDGRSAWAADRLYYSRGFSGQSGMCAIRNAVFDMQNVVAFYAPVRVSNTIVGVLVSVYREDTLTGFMTTSFFGEITPTYLCEPDGRIVAKAAPDSEDVQTIEDVLATQDLVDVTLEQINEDIATGESASFTTNTAEGVSNTYLTRLPSHDWTLVRSFPASITNGMVGRANQSGIILVVGIVLAAGLVAVAFTVQARRRNRQLLLERQEATGIIDASTNLFSQLLSIDLVNGEYEYLKSDELLKELPVTGPYEVLRESWMKTVAPQYQELVAHALGPDALCAELSKDVPYYQYEYRTRHEGAKAWLQVSVLCLARDEAGTPTDVLVAVQDVSEAKAKELKNRHALEEAFRAAEHASQAKSDFLNSMSHDIRTPMNSIMGMTAIASMHVDDPERVSECLANITSASRHLLGLINEVLDMAKIESGSISLNDEAFDIPEAIDSLLSIVNPQITAKNQELKVELVNIEHEHVIGDPTRLQQVFLNIMGNAIKFTPEGGTIEFKIRELPSRIPGSGCYEFVFADTGCGMSQEFLTRIFEPFARANDSRVTKIEGTGLGMPIAKSVVSLMNGTIDVESELDVGTTFTVTVYLRLRDGAKEDVASLKDVRVLVVDDEETACRGAVTLLEDIGMRASWRLSGQEGVDAVRAAEEEHDPFRAVILDWRMPGMSGVETARAIHETVTGDIPIIILSGYDWSMIEQEAREAGVHAFISKPLFRSRLIQVMKELVQGEATDTESEVSLLESCDFSGRRVLLTEDNELAAEIATEIIGLTGVEVDHAENGKIAVEKLTEHEPGYYDLVFMDIQMPVMNGYEAATAIRKAGEERPDLAEIPIIALSADAFAEDVKHASASGMNGHMAKPLDIRVLARTLQKWLPA